MLASKHTLDLTLIAAISRNGVIGVDGQLPWELPEDLQHFKRLTTGHTVIMGRKTWESLPLRFRPLPNRHNIVISRQASYEAAGAQVFSSLDDALEICTDGRRVFLIGGASLYAVGLARSRYMELTKIDKVFTGDTLFPEFDSAQWKEVTREPGVSRCGTIPYAFVSYERIELDVL